MIKIQHPDFILQPVGFEHKIETDKAREEFLSAKFQTTTLFCPSCGGERIFTAIHYTDALNIAIVYSTNEHKVASDNSIKRIKFACACAKSWVEIFLETMSDSRIVKVGQYPDIVSFDRSINREAVKMASKEERLYRLNAAKAHNVGLHVAPFN